MGKGRTDDCPDGSWGPPAPTKEPLLGAELGEFEPSDDLAAGSDKGDVLDATDKKNLIVSMCTMMLSIPALIGAWCWPALVIGVLSGTASAAARTLGHWISFGITLALMIVLNGFCWHSRKRRAGTFWQVNGPFVFTLIAAVFVMADITRHILLDVGWWKWCEANEQFPRVNQTWNDQCDWSSTQYECSQNCCIPDEYTTAVDTAEGTVSIAADGTYYGHAANMDLGSCDPTETMHYYIMQEFDYALLEFEVTNCDYGVLGPALIDDDNATLAAMEALTASDAPGQVVPISSDDCFCGCVPDETMSHLAIMGVVFTIIFTYLGFIFLAIGVMWNANIMSKLGKIKAQWQELRGQL